MCTFCGLTVTALLLSHLPALPPWTAPQTRALVHILSAVTITPYERTATSPSGQSGTPARSHRKTPHTPQRVLGQIWTHGLSPDKEMTRSLCQETWYSQSTVTFTGHPAYYTDGITSSLLCCSPNHVPASNEVTSGNTVVIMCFLGRRKPRHPWKHFNSVPIQPS